MARSDARDEREWWRHALIYQIYPRSFADANGDGVGDLAGVRSRLGYLRDLGVDAIWFTPWYVSPLADGGYDVADYRDIDPLFGTLAEAERLIAEALTLGIRTIVDIVPNHVSDRHLWFVEALDGRPRLARCATASGSGRARAPTAASRRTAGARTSATRRGPAPRTPTGRPATGTCTCSPRPSPTSTGTTRPYGPSTRTSSASGSTAAPAAYASTRPRSPSSTLIFRSSPTRSSPAATPSPTATSCTSCTASGARSPTTTTRHGRSSGSCGWRTATASPCICAPTSCTARSTSSTSPRRGTSTPCGPASTTPSACHASVGATPSWVLANHDVTRPLTRYGREDTSFSFTAKRIGTPTDRALGERRARAAVVLTAALPGSFYVYQGDELGLPEVEDLPADRIQDPMHFQSGGVDPGRDGCRVPLPWSGDTPPFGFSPAVRDRRAVAAPAGRLGGADRRAPGCRSGVDARRSTARRSPCAGSASAATHR